MEEAKKPFHEIVAEKLIEQLKQGTAPWQVPWEPGQPGAFMPHNPVTGNRYKGANAIQLMAQGYEDPRWMTYKQAQAVGAQVRKDEKGTAIQFWKLTEEKTKVDENGKPVLDEKGEVVKENVKLERPRMFMTSVFNAQQIDGLPPLERKPLEWNPDERAEELIFASRAKLIHSENNKAFYSPLSDSIHVPPKEQFKDSSLYYATVLHELGHWTGHETRLNRDINNPFGSEAYAKEELRAEIASMVIGNELGLGHDPSQHVAYVKSWIAVLENDPMEIFRAAADAEKIQTHILGLEQQMQERLEAARELAKVVNLKDQALEINDRGYISLYQNVPTEMAEIIRDRGLMGSSTLLPSQDGLVENEMMKIIRIAVDSRDVIFVPDTGHFRAVDGLVHIEGSSIWRKPTDDEIQTLIMEDLYDAHRRSAEGYSPLDSFRNLESTALQHGLKANIARGSNDQFESTYIVTYSEADGRLTTINTELFNNGKAVTSVNGDRVPGTGLTSEIQWQSEALARAVVLAQSIDTERSANMADDQEVSQSATNEESASQQNATSPEKIEERQYLAVPYLERKDAQAAGARWDKEKKSWYVGPNGHMEKLAKWSLEKRPSRQDAPLNPREEFADALRSVGCVVSGEHPIMDGKSHRIEVENDKKGEKTGFYVGYLDGHPAGYVTNNRTKAEIRWKAKGYTLDHEQIAQLNAEAAVKLQARELERAALYEKTAQRLNDRMNGLVPITQPTPYLESKGIQIHPGALTDSKGEQTYIPAIDADGKLWNMQYIKADGTKRFAKNSRKEGCFHIVGGDLDELAKAPAIVMSEGYATSATLSESLGYVTVAAFDSGNLPPVAEALHKRFPDKPIIVAGDDDLAVLITDGINPGRVKAEEAAKLIGGTAIFPIFAPNEQSANPNRFSDFNDLATNSVLGKEGVERQVNSVVSALVEKHKMQMDDLKVELKQEQSLRSSIRIS